MIPKTLGEYRDFCAAIDGEDGRATKYFDDKIKAHPRGRDEPVIADQTQMLVLIGSLLK